MTTQVDLLLTPAELDQLRPQDLEESTCVVFDVLRATSTMAMALHHGAKEIILVREIGEALALHAENPKLLLAGERGGKRISSLLTGSIEFDLGNSPREYTPDKVQGRSIVMTTTNGTRALHSCQKASFVLAASFLNLSATATALVQSPSQRLILVCAGTGDGASYEDTLGAGALLMRLPKTQFDTTADACLIAKQLFSSARRDLVAAFHQSTNGRRLAAHPDLHEDVAFCAQENIVSLPVGLVDNLARLYRGGD